MILPPLVVNPYGRRQKVRITEAIKIVAPNLPGPRVRLYSDPVHEAKLAARREKYKRGIGTKKRTKK